MEEKVMKDCKVLALCSQIWQSDLQKQGRKCL